MWSSVQGPLEDDGLTLENMGTPLLMREKDAILQKKNTFPQEELSIFWQKLMWF